VIGPTIGFSGSGGAGRERRLTREIAGEARIPGAAKAAVRCKPVLGRFLPGIGNDNCQNYLPSFGNVQTVCARTRELACEK